jgi:hypothetical protein
VESEGADVTTYKVTAATGFRGHAEGEEFEADLSEGEEKRAKARGSIRVVKRDDETPKTEGKVKG